MRRFFVVAVAIALTACTGNNSWSQTGGGGGGGSGGAGASGGAGGAGASGGASTSGTGTAGTGGAAGTAGTAGAAGTSGGVGTPGTAGTAAGNTGANVGAQDRAGVGQNRAGANAQMNGNVGINPSPFFADPAVRQQLRMTDAQFNQLNRAHQQALQRFNRSISGLDANTSARAGAETGNLTRRGPDTAADRRAEQQQERQQRLQDRQQARTNVDGAAGNSTAAQQRALRMQEFRQQFDRDFNGVVDTTFTDPAMRARFNQLNTQFQGFDAFNNPQIQQQLNLTAQQRQQVQVLAAEWRDQLRQLQTGNRTNLTPEQWNAMRNQFMNRLNTVLTPQQQQAWAQLIGPTHNFPMTAFVPPTNPPRNPPTATSRAAGVGTVQRDGTATNPNPIVPYGGTNRRAQNTQNRGNDSDRVR